jgi:hypothetical protein
MKTISHTTFTTVKTEGGILPADLLQRIAEGHVKQLTNAHRWMHTTFVHQGRPL